MGVYQKPTENIGQLLQPMVVLRLCRHRWEKLLIVQPNTRSLANKLINQYYPQVCWCFRVLPLCGRADMQVSASFLKWLRIIASFKPAGSYSDDFCTLQWFWACARKYRELVETKRSGKGQWNLRPKCTRLFNVQNRRDFRRDLWIVACGDVKCK